MNNNWNDQEAALCQTDLELRVYASRLLGQNADLVLHGGGNTSVKTLKTDIFGNPQPVLYVKGSGWDLGSIKVAGFAPVAMAHLLKLATLEQLSDTEMAKQLRVATLEPQAPAPSVEAILHALLPFKFVDHSHADALVTITNTPSGAARVQEMYGNTVRIVPYIMPGFELAKAVAIMLTQPLEPHEIGLVLLNHGLFTFADDAKTAYSNHIELVTRAEAYLQRQNAWQIENPVPKPSPAELRLELANLRLEVSRIAKRAMLLKSHQDANSLAFAQRVDVAKVATRGCATPDHIIRTKRMPLLGRDARGFAEAYTAEFKALARDSSLIMLDPAPRIVLDPEFGMVSLGASAADCCVAADIYQHTMQMITRAEKLEAWQALPPAELFRMEYWELEQAKLGKSKKSVFGGEIALVTGAASGIGKACAEAFLEAGAAVIGLDIAPSVTSVSQRQDYLGLQCDITDETALEAALETAVRQFGGLDMIVLNAGIFPKSTPIAKLELAAWQKVMQVNLDANLNILRLTHPLLARAPNSGRVVVIASKNVPAPGPGAAAYSASKAALTQLARVAALAWGVDGIRVNILHPNAVFDTGIWTTEVLEQRAASYGLSVEAYKTNNILRREVFSLDVANMAVTLCSPVFAKTTGAQIAVDGGNDRVI